MNPHMCAPLFVIHADPAGFRVNSGNHDPTIAWSLGASLAALNWQSWDKPCWVNEALFRDNGGCGYMKKPSWMIGSGKAADAPEGGAAGDGDGLPVREPRCLSVHVYSACYPQSKSQLCCGRVSNAGAQLALISGSVQGPRRQDMHSAPWNWCTHPARRGILKCFHSCTPSEYPHNRVSYLIAG